MTEQEKFDCYCKKHGHFNKTFFNRPHWTRRRFFEVMGAGVGRQRAYGCGMLRLQPV